MYFKEVEKIINELKKVEAFQDFYKMEINENKVILKYDDSEFEYHITQFSNDEIIIKAYDEGKLDVANSYFVSMRLSMNEIAPRLNEIFSY